VLLDDMNFKGRDAVLAALDAHPNIEIRIFNPFAHRGARACDFIANIKRINHRMHKLVVMDNALAIVGGRNIGDHYFQVDTEANFRDLDVVAGGPAVRKISSVFDRFFNGDWAVPISALVERPYSRKDLQVARATLRERIAADDYPYPVDQDAAELHDQGVHIRVLTNSLASNDVLAAHAGYAGRRKQVLESGVELCWSSSTLIEDNTASYETTSSHSRPSSRISRPKRAMGARSYSRLALALQAPCWWVLPTRG
jgi:putative cardiolipin synthase